MYEDHIKWKVDLKKVNLIRNWINSGKKENKNYKAIFFQIQKIIFIIYLDSQELIFTND